MTPNPPRPFCCRCGKAIVSPDDLFTIRLGMDPPKRCCEGCLMDLQILACTRPSLPAGLPVDMTPTPA